MKSGIHGNSVHLLLDTQILVWLSTGDPRLSASAKGAIFDPSAELWVSALTAFEFTDLQQRKRVPTDENIETLCQIYGFTLIGFPSGGWAVAATLPQIHRDPVDRMLIAHAIMTDMTLITSDSDMHKYPVKTLW